MNHTADQLIKAQIKRAKLWRKMKRMSLSKDWLDGYLAGLQESQLMVGEAKKGNL